MPAGKQADEEPGKEHDAESQATSPACKPPLGDKGGSAGKEDENEARREKSLLFVKNPARTHLQVLGKTQGRGDD